MAATYRVIMVHHAPFCEPVETPYGPATTDRMTAVATLVAAFDLHSRDSKWTSLDSLRIDVSNEDEHCGHDACHQRRTCVYEPDVPRGNSAVATTPNGGF